MKGLRPDLSDPLNMILVVLVILSLTGAWFFVKQTPGLDYYVAWVAADAVNNDTENNIYKRAGRYNLHVLYRNKAQEQRDAPRQKAIAEHRDYLPMTATPFMYWVTGLLTTGDYERDLSVWQALSLILLVAGVLFTCRVMGYSLATTLVLLMPVVIMFAPLHSDLRVGNVNSVQLGVIGLIFLLLTRIADNRYLFLTALLISLLSMFKPNLAPIAVLFAGGWLVRGQLSRLWVTVSGMATGIVLAVLVSSWWLGNASAWPNWLGFLRAAVAGGPGGGGGNYSPMTEVGGGLGPVGQLGLALAYCAACLLALWWGRRNMSPAVGDGSDDKREMYENTLLVATGCIVALLSSSLVWLHYYLLTLPMIIIALSPWRSSEPMKTLPVLMLRVVPMVALLLLLDTEVRTLLAETLGHRKYGVIATTTSAVALFVSGLWQIAFGIRDQRQGIRSRRNHPSGTGTPAPDVR